MKKQHFVSGKAPLGLFTMKKLKKNQHMHDRLHLSAAILARWQRPVASTKALDLLHRTMHAVFYRGTAAAIEMASKVGPLFCLCFVCCCSRGSWGYREQVVTRWWHLVASWVALDMPHQAMPSISLRRTAVAIKMANNRDAFVCHRQFCHQP